MRRTVHHCLLLVTAPDRKSARTIARALLESHTAACASLLPGLESHYRWKGRVESSKEILLLIKTTRARREAVEREILAIHPYETPEIIELPIASGLDRYLQWVTDNVQASAVPGPKPNPKRS